MKKLLLSLVALTMSTGLWASHLLGGQISVQCADDTSTSLLEYQATLVLLRDASGIPLGTTQSVTYSSPGTASAYASLQQVLTFTLPFTGSRSVEVHVFQGMLQLQQNNMYTFEWGECCRPMGINNIPNSGGVSMHYMAQLNTANCNSTPFFLLPPVLLWPDGIPWIGAAPALDTDGDSLYYNLDVPYEQTQSGGMPVAGYTLPPSMPGGAPTLHPNLGVFSYTADGQGSYSLVYEVEAYDNGQMTGMIRREVYIDVVPFGPGGSFAVSPAVGITGGAYNWTAGVSDTLVFEGMSSNTQADIQAQYFVPDYVDTSDIHFSFSQFKNASNTEAKFSWSPALSDVGMEFPVVIRFEYDGFVWDETFRASASASSIGLEEADRADIRVFPNPAVDQFSVVTDRPMRDMQIVHSSGKVVRSVDLSSVSGEWTGSTPETKGVYFIRFTDREGNTWTESLIVR